MSPIKDHTKLLEQLEALDIFVKNSDVRYYMESIRESLDSLAHPIYMDVGSSLKHIIKHRNLDFVDSGNVDIEGVRKIINNMEIDKMYSIRSQRTIRAVLNDIFDANFNADNFISHLINLSNLEENDPMALDNILLGMAQLINKRRLLKSLDINTPNEQELIDRVPAIYDITHQISNAMRGITNVNETEYVRKLIGALMKTINSSSTPVKAYGNICIDYLNKITDRTFSDNPEVLQLISSCFKEEDRVDGDFAILEHVSPTGLVAANLESEKNKRRFEIVNIMMESIGDISLAEIAERRAREKAKVYHSDSLITDTLTSLRGVVRKNAIKRYGKNLTLEIEPSDVFKLSHMKTVGQVTKLPCCKGTPVYFVANHSNLELVAKDATTNDIILISLISDNVQSPSLYNLTLENDMEGDTGKLSSRRIKLKDPKDMLYNVQENLELVNEGLKISEDGGIKLTYTPKKSYMDEYAQSHKIIHANYMAGNYEAMKTDLAFLFAFINHIESQIIYSNKPVKASKKEDATKARMFAINDFKTYLKKVQEHEPTFDFTRYFENIDTQKVLVEFSNSEIKGIRRLLRTILNF